MKKTIAALLCSLTLLMTACGSYAAAPLPEREKPAGISSALSVKKCAVYSEVYSAVKSAAGSRNAGGAFLEDSSSVQNSAASQKREGDYSATNVQVSGVDEGDIFKTDGSYIYSIADKELIIYAAAGKDSKILSRTNLCGEDEYPVELYVSGDRLAVVLESGMRCAVYNAAANTAADCCVPWGGGKTVIDLYDVSDPAAPKKLSETGQDGEILTSRLTDGRLYVVTNYCVWNDITENAPAGYVPKLYNGDKSSTAAAGDICILPEADNSYAVICAYDIGSGAILKNISILGAGSTLYMNKDRLYLARCDYTDTPSAAKKDSGGTVVEHRCENSTVISRVDLETLTLLSAGKIPGTLDTSYAMDEKDGYLRAAATNWPYTYSVLTGENETQSSYLSGETKSSSGVYVLDSGMNIVGRAENIAPDEYIRSVRFDGDIAYVCTYQQVDPLFAFDLSNPFHPVKLSELKITGFSEYLHPWAEGRLFGLGQGATEEGRVTGLKLVMFDTADKKDVSAIKSLEISGSYSNALYDPNAILIDYGKNLIGFPVDNGYELYSYSDSRGFEKLAALSLDDSGEWDCNMRGAYVGENLYIAGQNGLTVYALGDYSLLTTVKTA